MACQSSQNRLEEKPDAPSLKRFIALLAQRGCCFWDEDHLHEVIQIRGTKPDFYVQTETKDTMLVEVESFNPRNVVSNSVTSGLSVLEQNWMREKAYDAAEQLKPYSDLRIPMLVVLDDSVEFRLPKNADVLCLALYGQPEIRVSVDKGGAVDDPHFHHGPDQFFTSIRKRYISAVAWLLSTGEGNQERMFLRICHNRWANIPLPPSLLGDLVDEHWAYDQRGRWSKLESGSFEGQQFGNSHH